MTIPLITQRIEDLTVPENSTATSFNLAENFDDPLTTGQIARFEFADSSLAGGVTDVLLFDQAGAGAPETVANFSNYVTDNDYANSFIHRSIAGFVVQGGGYTFDPESGLGEVPSDPAVVNEFSSQRSNTTGTIAMAKLGNDPNSATNQWFFNLANNNASDDPNSLDNQNGGFTVFGQVLSDEDFAPIEAIAALPTTNLSEVSPAFSNLPVIVEEGETSIDGDNLVTLNNVSLLQEDELEFAVIENSNPELVEAIINEGQLSLNYAPNSSGSARITLQATNLLGDTVEDRFIVAVGEAQPDLNPQESTVYRFLNTDTGVHLYTSSEIERDYIKANLPNYTAEGAAYVSVDPFTGSPEPEKVYRFYNTDTGTHLYTISEIEKEYVEDNLENFSLETEFFFAFEEEQPGTIPVYRFYNTDTAAHFYTPSLVEKESVEKNLPNYQAEGIAYYTFPIVESTVSNEQ